MQHEVEEALSDASLLSAFAQAVHEHRVRRLYQIIPRTTPRETPLHLSPDRLRRRAGQQPPCFALEDLVFQSLAEHAAADFHPGAVFLELPRKENKKKNQKIQRDTRKENIATKKKKTFQEK